MEIYIAADHGGFNLKTYLKDYLQRAGFSVIDMGANELGEFDDYPDYVLPMMKEMQQKPESKGIVICRNGVGVSVLANKFKGIRAALSWSIEHVRTTREDDDTNVLALPADFVSTDGAREIVKAWLSTEFSNEERHSRRLGKFADLGE